MTAPGGTSHLPFLCILPTSTRQHSLSFFFPSSIKGMATPRSVRALACVRASAVPFHPARPISTPQSFAPCAAFSTSFSRKATPMGPPPQGFRLPRGKRWDEGKETSIDKASTYFLMTEMMRGMYVVLEQFFRPPLVSEQCGCRIHMR